MSWASPNGCLVDLEGRGPGFASSSENVVERVRRPVSVGVDGGGTVPPETDFPLAAECAPVFHRVAQFGTLFSLATAALLRYVTAA